MDISSLIGIILGASFIGFVGYEASHGHWMMFYSLEGFLLVFGGSISVSFMAMPMDKLKCVPGFIKRFMTSRGKNPVEIVRVVSRMADKVRRDGILSLESDCKGLEAIDTFLARGMRMAIDGVDAAEIETTLRLEILSMQERHKAGKKFFDLIKLYGPGYGLVGTLIGQIGMFGNLSGADVGVLGNNLAIAVCATMYGTVVANAIAGPIGDKLALRSSEEILIRELMLQGILSIQEGDNPRITMDKMSAFLPTVGRSKLKAVA